MRSMRVDGCDEIGIYQWNDTDYLSGVSGSD